MNLVDPRRNLAWATRDFQSPGKEGILDEDALSGESEMRILVVDDDEQFRSVLAEMLADEGYEILQAGDGDVALTLLENNSVDLVIMDIFMPNREGIETIVHLQKRYPDIKIIAISGGGPVAPEIYLSSARMLGALRSLEKPFRRDQLLNVIDEVMAQGG